MPVYSTSSVNLNGNSGSIVINVSDSIGGGDPVTYTFDIGVSLESSSYNFTGGNPAASSTFGNNGARWNGQQYTSGNPATTVTYNWSRTSPVATDYVVMLMNSDGTLHTHWGQIPGLMQAQPMSSVRWPDVLSEDAPVILQPQRDRLTRTRLEVPTERPRPNPRPDRRIAKKR